MVKNKNTRDNIIIISVVVGIIVAGIIIVNLNNKTVVQQDNLATISQALMPMTFEQKIEALKDEVMAKIMKGESAGIVTTKGELFPTFDPYRAILDDCRRIGGKMNLDCLSFGPLQFKLSTIILFEKELNGNDITEMEALVIAHDMELASKLFDDIVYGVEGGIWNWSVAQHDKSYYNTVIPIIRKLIE